MMASLGLCYLRRVSLIGSNQGTKCKGLKTEVEIYSYTDGEE